jgi:hypothetical protein
MARRACWSLRDILNALSSPGTCSLRPTGSLSSTSRRCLPPSDRFPADLGAWGSGVLFWIHTFSETDECTGVAEARRLLKISHRGMSGLSTSDEVGFLIRKHATPLECLLRLSDFENVKCKLVGYCQLNFMKKQNHQLSQDESTSCHLVN